MGPQFPVYEFHLFSTFDPMPPHILHFDSILHFGSIGDELCFSTVSFGFRCVLWLVTQSRRSCPMVASRTLYLSFSVPTLPAAVQSVGFLSMEPHPTCCWDRTHAQNISLTQAKGRGWEGVLVSKPGTQAWGPEFGPLAHKNRAWWLCTWNPRNGEVETGRF